jgi:hypothetical protein
MSGQSSSDVNCMAVLHYGSLSPVVLGEEPLVGGVPCDPMAQMDIVAWQ